MAIKESDLKPEILEAITEAFEELHPGKEVMCVGDMTEMPPEFKEAMENMKARRERSYIDERCFDCDRKMQKGEKGWSMYTDVCSGDPGFLVCPECEKAGVE